MKIKLLILITFAFFYSCSGERNKGAEDIFKDTWSLELVYFKNNELTNTIRNNVVYFNEDNTCSLPINRSKKTIWSVEYNDGIYSNFVIKSSDYYLTDEDSNNYLFGEYNLQFYESKSHLYLELFNDSVMFLLKRYTTILLQDSPVVINSLPYDKFIPYPDFYNEYGLLDDYLFNWFKDEPYPRIDSNFVELKKNYDLIKPILVDFLSHDSLTKVKSCFKDEYLSIGDVAIFIIDLLENRDLDELKNMNGDSCIYTQESFNSIKRKIIEGVDSRKISR